MLQRFSLDLNGTRVLLTFDEVINASSVIVSDITLQAGPEFESEMVSYTLQDGSVLLVDSNVITILLGPGDVNGLVLRSELATGAQNTFINITADALTDYYDNAFSGLDQGLQAAEYIPDTASPDLQSFSVDLNASQIILTFSESVDVSTLDVTMITLRNADGSQSFPLSDTSFSNSPNGDVVVVEISPEDFNVITANTGLFTGLENSYLSLTAEAIRDASGNQVNSITAIPALSYLEDMIPPTLTAFIFDLNTGLLTLTSARL